MTGGFNRWFSQESGYSLHRLPQRRRRVATCCGGVPERTGRAIEEYDPALERDCLYSLCRCKRCGRWFFRREGALYPIDNLLRYRVVKEAKADDGENCGSGADQETDGSDGAQGF